MAVNIYDELVTLETRVSALEALHKPTLRVGPVSYFFPGTKWDTMLAQPVAFCQINPASGPGTTISGSYVTQVGKAKAAGVPVFGYVHTKYGTRPVAEVKADADKYVTWYGVAGIFVDTTSNKLADLAYYADLCNYLRSKGLKLVLNPGTQTLEPYVGLADHLMVFEGTAANYRARVAPTWEASYDRNRFWHCVHTCTVAEMPALVALAKSRNCGLFYATDDVMTNPYDTLPTYFDALVREVAA